MKKENIIFVTICAALFATTCLQLLLPAIWLMTLLLMQMNICFGNGHLYWQIIEDYPVADCVKPTRFQFMFRKIKRHTYKEIPKEMYYANIIIFMGFVIYTFIGIIFLFVNQKIGIYIGLCYILIAYGWNMRAVLTMEKKAFLARFKKLNIHNFIYVFGVLDDPYPREKGKCKIVSEYRRGKRTYVTIRMIDTDEVKEKILFPGNKRQGDNPTYSLYEICKVLYII